MCGIWLYLVKYGKEKTLSYGEIYESFMKTKHRGPDRSIMIDQTNYGFYIGFHRLAIMDLTTRGDQPFTHETPDKIYYVVCNGEIYNFHEIVKKHDLHVKSGSDCEVIIHLFVKYGMDFTIKEIDGEFAFYVCEVDKLSGEVIVHVGRDQAGVRPLYIAGSDDELILSSELKSVPKSFLDNEKYGVQQFPPRSYMKISNKDEKIYDIPSPELQYGQLPDDTDKISNKMTRWFDIDKIKVTVFDYSEALQKIRDVVLSSIRSMVEADRELVAFASGGLDSSIVSKGLSDIFKEQGKQLTTCCIGIDGCESDDQKYARLVAKHIGSDHIEINSPIDEHLDIYKNKIVYVTESNDCTTNRASTPMFISLQKPIIKNGKIVKIVVSGEGADEIFGGYMYFHYAPNEIECEKERKRLINMINFSDGERADRCIAGNGLEGRFPLLRKKVLETIFSIDPKFFFCGGKEQLIEKKIFRDAFYDENFTYLPKDVLYRVKVAFSDGVSSKKKYWYKIIQESLEDTYTDENVYQAKDIYTHMIPFSKETLFVRDKFNEFFSHSEKVAKIIPDYWMPKWIDTGNEVSATVIQLPTD